MSRFSSSSGRLEMYARHPGGDYKLLGRGTANRFENSFFGDLQSAKPAKQNKLLGDD